LTRVARVLAAAAGAALLASCASAPVAPVRSPDTDEYVYPRAQPGELSPAEARDLERAWHDVLAGKTPSAEKRLAKMLAESPGLIPAEVALAFARMRAGIHDDAAKRFAAVLERRPEDLSALIGLGAASVRLERIEDALAAYSRAAALDPANESLRRRRAELRLRVTEAQVTSARAAAASGATERAVEEYRRVLAAAPELSDVRLELADLLAKGGDRAGAMGVLDEDPSRDRQVRLRLAEMAAAAGDLDRALEAYRRILDADPRDDEAAEGARRVRETMEMQSMPEEYRLIADSETITRADLAALVMVKVRRLSRVAPGPGRVAIDISGSWARDHIIRALAYEILTVYPNHTFQPGATVRRGDLARAVARVLDLLKFPAGPAVTLTDMGPGNLLHYPAGRAVGAGLMDLTGEGAFEPWRPVSGREASDVIENLVRLVGT
jgi:tetratricopeptide (TPR) repeat protein